MLGVTRKDNRTIMPLDAATTATINAIETGNLTLNLKTEWHSSCWRAKEKGDNNNGAEQENATALIVNLDGVRPNDPRFYYWATIIPWQYDSIISGSLRKELLLQCGNEKVQSFSSRVVALQPVNHWDIGLDSNVTVYLMSTSAWLSSVLGWLLLSIYYRVA